MKFAHFIWAAFPFFVMANVAGVTLLYVVFFALAGLVLLVVVCISAAGMLLTRLIVDYIRASMGPRK